MQNKKLYEVHGPDSWGMIEAFDTLTEAEKFVEDNEKEDIEVDGEALEYTIYFDDELINNNK